MPGLALALAMSLMPTAAVSNASVTDAGIDWVALPGFDIARTETTVAQFRRYARATGRLTQAEQSGGGEVYEAGWTKKPGWTWQRPFGSLAADDEPAVHISFPEAAAFCRWAGGRLPRDAEWAGAAYLEQRAAPPAPFERNRRYPFPSGATPQGSQCLDDCGSTAAKRAVRHGARLWRGSGHAATGRTPAGVNGLHDMGGNAWEWVDDPPGLADSDPTQRRTRGGSWWYGAAQMREDHGQTKPPGTAVVYIGFRCVR